MKRDWNLLRTILLEIERLPDGEGLRSSFFAGKVDGDRYGEHKGMLYQAGMYYSHSVYPEYDSEGKYRNAADKISWQGRELLAMIRDDQMWMRINRRANEIGVELTLDAIKILHESIVRRP